jgi:hypothetical protein
MRQERAWRELVPELTGAHCAILWNKQRCWISRGNVVDPTIFDVEVQ